MDRRTRGNQRLRTIRRRPARQAHRRSAVRDKGIQVDGGSEFRADFEAACKAKNLALYVLPPKRPELNGAVERAQSSWQYEFYACYDLPARLDKLLAFVDAFAHRFNHVRPHDALDGKTPAEYLQTISAAAPSHMS